MQSNGLLLSLAAVCGLLGCSSSYRLPNDAELIAQYKSNSDDFTTLAEMLKSDSQLTNIYDDGSMSNDGKDGVSEIRAEEYRKILNNANLKGAFVFRDRETDGFCFKVRPRYASYEMCWKGFVYSTAPIEPLKEDLNLDGLGALKAGETWYKQIDPNWYLFVKRYSYSD